METKKCLRCGEEKPLELFYKDGPRCKSNCKLCHRIIEAEYRSNNRERIRQNANKSYVKRKVKRSLYAKEYNSRPEIKKRNRERIKSKRNSDPIFNLANSVRCRINKYIKGFLKKSSSSLVGCCWEELKIHLEKQFKDGMSWENRNEWHIDHIIPLSSAKTLSEIETLCHFSNLQPLWAKENLSKGNKMP